MRLVRFCCVAVVSASFAVAAPKECRAPPEMRPALVNLNFTEGAPGSAPSDWYLGPEWFRPQFPRGHEAKPFPVARATAVSNAPQSTRLARFLPRIPLSCIRLSMRPNIAERC
jgi:hypothetical protein